MKLIPCFAVCFLVSSGVRGLQYEAPPPSGDGAAKKSADVDPDVSHIFVGLRHGIRNPENFCCNYESPDEVLYLTKKGKEEAWNVGKFVRERYADLLDTSYKSEQLAAVSSSAARCQQTLQSFLAGFYPVEAGSGAIPALKWEPVPYRIDDPMVRMYKVDCPASDKAWAPVSYDTWEPMAKILEEKSDLIDFAIEKSGLTVGDSKLSTMADIADNLLNLEIHGGDQADWVSKGMPGVENLREAIAEFGEIHQIACAQYAPCRRMMSGYWLNDIMKTLEAKLDGDKEDQKMNLYASHTEITLAAIYAMGVDQEVVEEVPMGGGFIVEFKETPTPSARVLYLHPDVLDVTKEPELTVVTPGGEDWISIEKLLAVLKENSFSDWEAECGLTGKSGACEDETSGASEEDPSNTSESGETPEESAQNSAMSKEDPNWSIEKSKESAERDAKLAAAAAALGSGESEEDPDNTSESGETPEQSAEDSAASKEDPQVSVEKSAESAEKKAAAEAEGESWSADTEPLPESGMDGHEYCCYWAQEGQCDTNPFWMRPRCQKSCGTTDCTIAGAKSCGVNVNTEGCQWTFQGSPVAPDPMDSDNYEPPEGCEDFNQYCPYWASLGECENNASFMTAKCPVACKSC